MRWIKGMLDAREGGNGGNLDWGLLLLAVDDDADDVMMLSVVKMLEGENKSTRPTGDSSQMMI